MTTATLLVIAGPMFAGKSTQIYHHVSRAIRSKKKVEVIVPKRDTRSKGQVVTHNGVSLANLKIKPKTVESSREMYDLIPSGTDFVVIEEAQFLDIDLPLYVLKLLSRETNVIAAGLDLTSEGFPFGSMPHLMVLANRVEKLTAICPCGEEATRTLCLVEKTDTIFVGGSDKYLPACFQCWSNGGKDWDHDKLD